MSVVAQMDPSMNRLIVKGGGGGYWQGNRLRQHEVSDDAWNKTRRRCSHHDGDLPLVDVEVRDVVDIHPFESAADAAVCAGQEDHREASCPNKQTDRQNMRILLKTRRSLFSFPMNQNQNSLINPTAPFQASTTNNQAIEKKITYKKNKQT